MNLILLDRLSIQIRCNGDATENNDDSSSAEFVLASSDNRAKHIRNHLKKTKGDRIRIGLFPNGPLGEAVITSIDSDAVHVSVDDASLRPPPDRPLIKILIGMPYPRVVKALWSVLASFGVDEIIYGRAELTEADFLETSALTPKVYEPLLREGLSQGMDTRQPKVTILPKDTFILDWLRKESAVKYTDCCKIFLHIQDGVPTPSIRRCYQEHAKGQKGILLAIGPERGWTDKEAAAFVQADFLCASLGEPILRTDTSAISAIALSRDVLLEQGSSENGKANLGKRSKTAMA